MCARTRPRLNTLIRKSFWGMESEPMLTPREKTLYWKNSPQRRMEPTMQHQARHFVGVLSSWLGLFVVCSFTLICLSEFDLVVKKPSGLGQHFSGLDCLGLEVRRLPTERGKPGFDPCFPDGASSLSINTIDVKTGTPVATVPGAWHERVSTGTSLPGVSILSLGKIASLIWNVCLSVAVHVYSRGRL